MPQGMTTQPNKLKNHDQLKSENIQSSPIMMKSLLTVLMFKCGTQKKGQGLLGTSEI
jgi:hypothetical protein